ncbi:hypothetical protein EDB82DRAFT_553583, partial [Fusarium venenatum]|uniref:uncharacterized protein n=1 Tax=Fusarium venenatum TaxID=56646 RepID=UPI001D9EF2DF
YGTASILSSLSTSEGFSSTFVSASTSILTHDAATTTGAVTTTTTLEELVLTDTSSTTERAIVESTTSTEPSSTMTEVSYSSTTTTNDPTSTSMSTSAATTSEAPTPSFRVVPFRPPFNGQPIVSNQINGHLLSFPATERPEYTTGIFTIDPRNGHLLLDNTLPICAFFGIDANEARLKVCPASLTRQ